MAAVKAIGMMSGTSLDGVDAALRRIHARAPACRSIAMLLRSFPSPRAWIVAGGGARNPTPTRMLTGRLAPATVETADAVGWSSQAMEAQAFGYLTVRTLNGLPIAFPKTAGVARPLGGGLLAQPKS